MQLPHVSWTKTELAGKFALRFFIRRERMLPLRKKIARRFDDMIADGTARRLQITSTGEDISRILSYL